MIATTVIITGACCAGTLITGGTILERVMASRGDVDIARSIDDFTRFFVSLTVYGTLGYLFFFNFPFARFLW